MKHPSYVMQMGGYHNQMGDLVDDFKSWSQDLVTEYIDDPLRELGDNIGLSEEEIDRIAAETNKAYQQELANKQKELLAQITGQTQQAAGPSYTDQLQTQIANLQSQLERSVPGGMTTIYAAGGLLGGFVLYKIFAGPK
jgi:parvulin-like peptidyl-prolyl isomerase